MTKNEFTLKLTKIILNDWRKVMLAESITRYKLNLPGDSVDIAWRAMHKADEMADDFYKYPEDE